MSKTRKCAHCGKVFTTKSGMQKFCSEECAEQAKEARKKRQRVEKPHAFDPRGHSGADPVKTFSSDP